MSLAILFNAKFGGTQQHPYKLENVRMSVKVFLGTNFIKIYSRRASFAGTKFGGGDSGKI